MQGIANGDIIFTANSGLGDTPESQTYTVSVKTPDGTQTPIMENYSPDFEAMKVSIVTLQYKEFISVSSLLTT